jgi:integrase
MAIFDKNQKRAKALLKAGGTPEKIKHLFNTPDWFVRYYDKRGVCHEEKCPQVYQSRDGALKYYKVVSGKTVTGDHIIPKIRKTTIRKMVVFFMWQYRKKVRRTGKLGGFSSAKCICKHIVKDLGSLTFDECRENPMVLQDRVDRLRKLHPTWSDKYLWNIHKELHAVFSLWIKKKQLNTPNPTDALDVPEPNVEVIDYLPTHEDYERIIATGLIEGVRSDVLRLIGAVRYTGFRINEVLGWHVEDCNLNPDEGIPYIMVIISKQKRRIKVPRPIRFELAKILREQIGERVSGPVWPWVTPPYKLLKVYEYSDRISRNGHPVPIRFKGDLYKLAGVDVPRPFHDFRKTVKLELKRHLDKDRARQYQGHKTDAMDDYYTFYQRVDLEDAVKFSYNRKDKQ